MYQNGRAAYLVHYMETARARSPLTVAHQAAGCGELSVLEDRGHCVAERKFGRLAPVGILKDLGLDLSCSLSALSNGLDPQEEDRLHILEASMNVPGGNHVVGGLFALP